MYAPTLLLFLARLSAGVAVCLLALTAGVMQLAREQGNQL
jgi:hypothetical protein